MSMKKSQRLTDPLAEFAAMALTVRSHAPNEGGRAYGAFNSLIQKPYMSAPAFHAYSIINRRSDRLVSMVESIPSEDLEAELNDDLCRAIRSVQSVFSPDCFFVSWNSMVAEKIKEKHITAMQYAAKEIRKHYPLRYLSPDELTKAENAVIEAIQELIEVDHDQGWITAPLLSGLQEMLFILQNIVLFGQDEAINALTSLHSKASGVSAEITRRGVVSPKLNKLVVAFGVLVLLITKPKDIAEGIVWWQDSARSNIEISVPLLTPPPPLQIEGPKVTEAT